ncbi:NADH-quinone oxidoreductase subunit J family protein [Anaerosinus gibii]|uniref:NADH-quinone oxidoreductase subunit J n=1 Tax=Selenobaculum gibii TaxID=3054208 RepID=A0A9Y2EQI4_9FIRM|nr:NADH-quinone oxidoreductase subunit J [Selenobaculum gbiensis]WIW70052.1 NADH-quinone oxidoreductase subunit J [Selenobaculum gbiensis]
MNELVYSVAFYLLAAVTLFAAIGVVAKKNLVHSALLLTVSFIGVAGVYILLHADFLAAVQILVYAGAVAILITLGVMLTRRESMDDSNPDHGHKMTSLFLVGLFAIVMISIFVATPWQLDANLFTDTVGGIAELLLNQYIVAFEVAAALLLVAMVGAIILAKGADEV